eukprot:CAMPEP_0182507306 /NCGR_PEP_ID=MMETSP1321-20130603/22856_1 /TAXON_ID=91990 /ORGANISM="Bolidomonas sp., Strain RCC1657" /LENGTH=68 /DNA_ID=CAMNT_0024713179 /DNA_START=243 /DNA_END=445 /DNA_ORIENTATION=-
MAKTETALNVFLDLRKQRLHIIQLIIDRCELRLTALKIFLGLLQLFVIVGRAGAAAGAKAAHGNGIYG